MAYPSLTARTACDIQKTLVTSINDDETKGYDKAFIARVWLEIEFAKREWRGLPRLSTHGLKELLAIKRENMKRAQTGGESELGYTEEQEEPADPPSPSEPPSQTVNHA